MARSAFPPPLADCSPPPLPLQWFAPEGLEASLEGDGGLQIVLEAASGVRQCCASKEEGRFVGGQSSPLT